MSRNGGSTSAAVPDDPDPARLLDDEQATAAVAGVDDRQWAAEPADHGLEAGCSAWSGRRRPRRPRWRSGSGLSSSWTSPSRSAAGEAAVGARRRRAGRNNGRTATDQEAGDTDCEEACERGERRSGSEPSTGHAGRVVEWLRLGRNRTWRMTAEMDAFELTALEAERSGERPALLRVPPRPGAERRAVHARGRSHRRAVASLRGRGLRGDERAGPDHRRRRGLRRRSGLGRSTCAATVPHRFHDIAERLEILVVFAPAEYSQAAR